MSEIIELVTRETVVIETPSSSEVLVVESDVEVEVVEVAEQGAPGAPGSPPGGLSNDVGNAITHGSDGGIYTPDALPTDPLAYYILARS